MWRNCTSGCFMATDAVMTLCTGLLGGWNALMSAHVPCAKDMSVPEAGCHDGLIFRGDLEVVEPHTDDCPVSMTVYCRYLTPCGV